MILVTGAAGFIGSNILADLEQAGFGPLVACDFFDRGDKWSNIEKRQITQLISPEELTVWLQKQSDVKAVIHMGAISSTLETNFEKLNKVNVELTIALWDICARVRTH